MRGSRTDLLGLIYGDVMKDSRIYMEQEDAYDALLEKTMVEMPFRKDSLREKVILYVSDTVLNELKRAKIDIRTGRTV